MTYKVLKIWTKHWDGRNSQQINQFYFQHLSSRTHCRSQKRNELYSVYNSTKSGNQINENVIPIPQKYISVTDVPQSLLQLNTTHINERYSFNAYYVLLHIPPWLMRRTHRGKDLKRWAIHPDLDDIKVYFNRTRTRPDKTKFCRNVYNDSIS